MKICSLRALASLWLRSIQIQSLLSSSNQGREYLLYTTQMTRDKVDTAIDFFLDTIAQPAFKPWELSDNTVNVPRCISSAGITASMALDV